MAFILQKQRRAIEAVFSVLDFTIADGSSFFLEDGQLNLLGISNGVGTCSDKRYHGVDVAVFSREFPFNPQFHHRLESSVHCQGAVILRSPTQGEIEELKRDRFYLDQSRLAVEGLEVASVSGNEFRFKSNSRSTTYVELA